jgi:hypothetical protein
MASRWNYPGALQLNVLEAQALNNKAQMRPFRLSQVEELAA